jgi:putative membrane protein
MILPGLSGSFVLIIMGNYALVIGAIGKVDLGILVPLALGCGFGLVAFSHVLAWIFSKWHDQTISLMTGFILGSLAIIWPWKETITELIARDGKPAKEIVTGFDWFLPSFAEPATWLAIVLIAAGALSIWLLEKYAAESLAPDTVSH